MAWEVRSFGNGKIAVAQGAESTDIISNERSSVLGVWCSQQGTAGHAEIVPLTSDNSTDDTTVGFRVRAGANSSERMEPPTPIVLDHGFSAVSTGDSNTRVVIFYRGSDSV
jgi:hypothetical protein